MCNINFMQTQTAHHEEVSHDQGLIAVMVIKAWKTSPALTKWFHGLTEWHAYLDCYDFQTVHTICKTHLQAKGNYKPLGMKSEQVKNTSAVALSGSDSYMTTWYGRTVCKLCELTNASNLWAVCYTAALIQ